MWGEGEVYSTMDWGMSLVVAFPNGTSSGNYDLYGCQRLLFLREYDEGKWEPDGVAYFDTFSDPDLWLIADGP